MELYKRTIEIVDWNLIYCLIPMLLTLILIELLFTYRFETKKVLNLIRWTIIIYTIVILTDTIIRIAMDPERFTFTDREPYNKEYWIMFLSPLILPFTLLIKKLASNFSYILFVAFFIKIGFYFERFVLIVTHYQMDSLTENGNQEYKNLFLFTIGMLFLQGITFAVLALGYFEIRKQKLSTNQ